MTGPAFSTHAMPSRALNAQLEEANYYQKLYYHRLGTPQSEDTLIYERPDQKEWGFGGGVTEDGQYLIISVWLGTDPQKSAVLQRPEAAGQPGRGADQPALRLATA